MEKPTNIMIIFLLILMLLFLSGCSIPYQGNPSLTLITRDIKTNSNNIELVGGVDEESIRLYWILTLLIFGERPTHEAVVAQMLEKHHADVLLNAELSSSSWGVPYLFMVNSATVKGQPARFVTGGVK